MNFTDSLRKNFHHELTTCQHLYAKFSAESAEWKPQDNMRNTVQLMQYLTYIGKAMVRQYVTTPADPEAARNAYRADAKWATENVTFENFSDMIELEKKEISDMLAGISDADLERETYHPFSGDVFSLYEGLFTTIRYVCAYRHQLFLYAKMNGAEINTLNNWYGKDPAPKAA